MVSIFEDSTRFHALYFLGWVNSCMNQTVHVNDHSMSFRYHCPSLYLSSICWLYALRKLTRWLTMATFQDTHKCHSVAIPYYTTIQKCMSSFNDVVLTLAISIAWWEPKPQKSRWMATTSGCYSCFVMVGMEGPWEQYNPWPRTPNTAKCEKSTPVQVQLSPALWY